MTTFVSLFSGVGGFDLGLERAGWRCVAQVEWDQQCHAVLARHWPDVPRWSDVADVSGYELPPADVVAFGSPCQDLSVAGKRAGFTDGGRSNLFFEAIRIIKEMRDATGSVQPRFVIWENVVGALSSNQGDDFAAVLDALAESGAVDIGWRVLDARWYGVPQRRRRVFVVADFAGRCAGAVSTEPEGVCWDSDPCGASGPSAARGVGAGVADGGVVTVYGFDSTFGAQSKVNVDLSATVKVGSGLGIASPPAVMHDEPTVFVKGKRASSPTDDETWHDGGPAPTLKAFDNGSESRATVAIAENQRGELVETDVAHALQTGGTVIRRLTPLECERLMGWPDDHTRWRADGTEVSDSARYRMCGNGVASPVAHYVAACINRALEQEGQP
jgi:DNA (cytosine-5)-methyltransferase 1